MSEKIIIKNNVEWREIDEGEFMYGLLENGIYWNQYLTKNPYYIYKGFCHYCGSYYGKKNFETFESAKKYVSENPYFGNNCHDCEYTNT